MFGTTTVSILEAGRMEEPVAVGLSRGPQVENQCDDSHFLALHES